MPSPAAPTAPPPRLALALLAGLLFLLSLSACVPATITSLRAPVNLSEPDPILAQNSGLLAEQHLPESEQAPVAAAPLPAPGALTGRAAPLRLKALAEVPPKATDIPEFPSLDDLEVEARLERLSKLPPSLGLDVVRTGLTQKGRRYRWGGAIPSTGFDCSGFTQWSFQQHDISLPRTAREQFGVGERIQRHELRAGDLVFYKINRRGRWHVGIYMEDGVFVHSPRRGRSISEANMSDSYWAKRYMGARRYVR
jgi:cell wall-associated NlpC family hydrolase